MSASPSGDAGEGDWLTLSAQRIAAGDRAAEGAVVAHFMPGVRALVRRHCRPSEPEVDDLVQDVLASVLQALRKGALADLQSLPGYVRATVVFTVQAHYRKRGRRGEDEAHEGVAEPVDHEHPAQAAQRAARIDAVRRLIQEMPVPRDRELLRRFYLQEQEREEVCQALGIEGSHFHRVLYRARERLRLLLAGSGLTGDTT
jgi:RNA polymerase sigma-70 factor (ECF subfamily)